MHFRDGWWATPSTALSISRAAARRDSSSGTPRAARNPHAPPARSCLPPRSTRMASIHSIAAVAQRRTAVLFGVLVLAGAISCSGRAQDFGDTPYVQTPQNVVDRMLQVAHMGAADYVIDLGSGDGRMVITAAKK